MAERRVCASGTAAVGRRKSIHYGNIAAPNAATITINAASYVDSTVITAGGIVIQTLPAEWKR